jgi:glycosyltransferase involved in cell wall biosynthesis
MKDGFEWDHPRVRVFNQVDHDVLRKIYNSCSIILCTSVHETQHLAGIEGASCGLPVVATNVGVYYNEPDGEWGHRVSSSAQDFAPAIKKIMDNPDSYSPREYFLKKGLNKVSCKNAWNKLVDEIKNEN